MDFTGRVYCPAVGSGTCQGVIALNMEDGTLHRIRAASTILATGVRIIPRLSLILAFPSFIKQHCYFYI